VKEGGGARCGGVEKVKRVGLRGLPSHAHGHEESSVMYNDLGRLRGTEALERVEEETKSAPIVLARKGLV